MEKKAMRLAGTCDTGKSVWGWFYPESSRFWCTHGGWEARIKFIDDNTCEIFGNTKYYEFVDSIPDDYNRC